MNTESGKEIRCESQSVFKVCTVCKIKRDSFKVAPYFVCAFFRLETNRVTRVCNKCYGEAENHQSALVNLLADNKSIFSGPSKPTNEVEIVDLDDDDDDDDNDSPEELEECQEEVEMEDNVDSVIKDVMEKYQFREQLDAASLYLRKKYEYAQDEITKLDVSNSELATQISTLRKELFEPYEPILCHVDSVDIDEEGKVSKHSTTLISCQAVLPLSSTAVRRINELPPVGEFVHKHIELHQTIYAMKDSLLKPWVKGCVSKIKDNSEMPYDVCFENATDKLPRKFPLKYLAYAEPSPVQLTVGARIIAQYVGEENGDLESLAYYAGIVAEEAKFLNQERYLVFFDQGYVQYCKHEQIMMVCRSSKDVWHDVYSKSRYFVSSYLNSYPERAMVKLQRGQTIKTELNGYWFNGRVDTVDASMARIYFASEKRFEWIYRGSTRFRHLYDLLANEEARKKQGDRRPTRPIHNMSVVHKKKNAPYVEYTGGNVDDSIDSSTAPPSPSSLLKSQSSEYGVRSVARKSTSSRIFKSPTGIPVPRRKTDSSEVDALDDQIKRQLNVSFRQVYFEPHQCGSECLREFPYADGGIKNVNPFSIPMRWGWSREIGKQRNSARNVVVFYRAPCGRRVRNMDELHRYLRITKSELGVDLFCFDNRFDCFRQFEPEIVYSRIEDISYGKENVPVSCVNSIDRSYPEHVHYCTKRIPRDGVVINLDPDFLVCCDCTDDCQDKEKCRCWQLTITSTARGPGGKIDPNAGYEYRRISQPVTTAIYECNSRCSCRKTCLNRVVQNPLQLRLQLFRTMKCGWGIRCLDDIPKGQFISVYVGELLTDNDANKYGKQFGDEYLADLNFIELTEGLKDGYESESYQSDLSSLESQSSSDDWDASSDHSGSKNSRSKKEAKKLRTEKSSKSSSCKAVKPIEMDDDLKNGTRKFYGPNEFCFVIDARNIGNLGRYFNHSCEPNIFGQNAFVDTQDLRFPWLALFAKNFIPAGTELTWDYGYEVGSVPGRKLDCYCGSKQCRRRLL